MSAPSKSAAAAPVAAVAYVRTANPQQMEHVNAQLEVCERIATEQGWTITERYVDHGQSSSPSRPAYEAMKEALAAGKFGALVVSDLDRLTRRPRELEHWLDAAAEGLQIATGKRNALDLPSGRANARLSLVLSNYEAQVSEAARKAAQA